MIKIERLNNEIVKVEDYSVLFKGDGIKLSIGRKFVMLLCLDAIEPDSEPVVDDTSGVNHESAGIIINIGTTLIMFCFGEVKPHG
jgi:hypothetical protein